MMSKSMSVPMATVALVALLLSLTLSSAAAGSKARKASVSSSESIHAFTVKNIDGKSVKLDKYRGDVCLVVNVASRCGLTPQYAGLESLYRKYKDRGFRILGFPANNFGKQEPGSNKEIKKFCKKRFDVTFPMFAKISVKGDDQAPLYRFLTEHPDESIAGEVMWNFQKYLVGRDGKVIKKFHPRVKPDAKELIEALEGALASTPSAKKRSATP